MKIKLLLIALFLSIGIVGCDDKEDSKESSCPCEKSEEYKEVKNIKGIVYYNEQVKEWNIVYEVPNTYDSAIAFISCNIPEHFKQNGIRVVFSGKAYSSSFKSPVGGKSYMCLEVSSIIPIRGDKSVNTLK